MLAGGRGSGGGPRGKGGMELKRRENIVSRVSERSSQRGKKMVLGARVERRNIEGPGCLEASRRTGTRLRPMFFRADGRLAWPLVLQRHPSK